MSQTQKGTPDASVPLPQANIAAALIEAQLDRLLHCAALEGKTAEKKLLNHLVKESAAGRVARLRVPEITRALYRKYDPGDSRIRGDAKKLREHLDDYYATEAKPGEIRFSIPAGQYVVYAPQASGANAAWRDGSEAGGIAHILEPSSDADVHRRVKVRGRVDVLDPDMRLWLVVRTPSGMIHPQDRLSRRSPEWEGGVLIGREGPGLDNGVTYEIGLVATGINCDVAFYTYLKSDRNGEGFGTVLPADCTVLDTRRVTRRDPPVTS